MKPRFSIIIPVRNEVDNLKIMIPLLEAGIEIPHETLVVYDFPEDTSVGAVKRLEPIYPNVRLVLNDLGAGIPNAIKKGVAAASCDIILITAVDELFRPAVVGEMLGLIDAGCDFVSTTRFRPGAKDIRDSFIEGVLSRTANKLFQLITGSILTDATTGIKMMKKIVFDKIAFESRPIGWSFAFELSIKVQLLGLKVGEIPVVSIDRLFGGKSTFNIIPWTKEYLRWFLWGVRRLNRFNRKQKRVITISK